MSNAMVYAGIAIGVAAIAAAIVYGTENQQNYIPEDAVPAQATIEGELERESDFSPRLNKEQWHADPFADEAAEVRANLEK